MFVGTFNGVSIGFSVVVDTVPAAGYYVGLSIVTYMDASVGIIVSVSVMKLLQCDVESSSEEMVFPYRARICMISHRISVYLFQQPDP